jgi:hypothetical protein
MKHLLLALFSFMISGLAMATIPPATGQYDFETIKARARTELFNRDFDFSKPGELSSGHALGGPFRQKTYILPGDFIIQGILTEEYVNNVWVYNRRETRYYDGESRLIEVKYENYDPNSNIWVNFQRDIYSYGQGYVPDSAFSQIWDTEGMFWEDFFQSIYTWHVNGGSAYYDEILLKVNFGGMWLNTIHLDFTYNGDWFVILLEEDEFDFMTQQRFDVDRTHYTYNSSNKLTVELRENFDEGAWINNELRTYTYDDLGFNTQMLQQHWGGGSGWIDNDRFSYTYDDNGQVTTELVENKASGSWVNTTLTTNSYDDNGNLFYQLHQEWADRGSWVDAFRDTYTYTGTTGLKEKLPAISVTVFPNPATDHVIFTFSDLPDRAYLTITDQKGSEVHRRQVDPVSGSNNRVIWGIPNGTAPGLFFFNLESLTSKTGGKFLVR